jgi:hypothetical protein
MMLAALVCGVLLWVLRLWHPEGNAETPDGTGLLFPRGLEQPDAIIIEKSDYRMELQRQGSSWSQVSPFSAAVDAVAVQRMLDALADIQVRERMSLDELLRRNLQLKDFGLAPAQTRVIVRTLSRRIELCFGRLTPDGREVYFYQDVARQVLVAPCAVLASIPASLESVRERALLRDTGRTVTALEFRQSDQSYIKLTHGGMEWQMVLPTAAAADGDRVETMLAILRKARIESFVWPSAVSNDLQAAGSVRSRLALYGLDSDAALQVQFWESGGPGGVRLRFGKAVEGHPGWVYALTVDEQGVVAVTNTVLTALQVQAADLRDSRLFREKLEEISRVQLRFANQLVECRREGVRPWVLVSPQQDTADPEQVGRLLVGLLRLRAARVLDPPAGVIWGAPTNPVCVVELGMSGGDTVFSVSAAATAGRMEVVFTNAPTRYVVETAQMPAAVLSPKGAFGLRDRTVMTVATSAVRRIAVRCGAEMEAVERTANGSAWMSALEGRPGTTVDAPAAWLALLARLPAVRIERLGPMTAAELEGFGLTRPVREIEVELLAEDALRKVLLLGGRSTDGGQYAMLRGHDAVFVLGAETAQVLERKLVAPVTTQP